MGFNDPGKSKKAERLVKEKRSYLLIGSPMCNAFSQLQTLNFKNMDEGRVGEIIDKATVHSEFCIKLYNIQADMGLYFLHEHPEGATSWNND